MFFIGFVWGNMSQAIDSNSNQAKGQVNGANETRWTAENEAWKVLWD